MNDFTRFTSQQERRIARNLLKAIFASPGSAITVDNADEVTGLILNEKDAYQHLASTGSDLITVYRSGERIGGVLLVWGNGEDLITDYSATAALEAIVDPIMEALY